MKSIFAGSVLCGLSWVAVAQDTLIGPQEQTNPSADIAADALPATPAPTLASRGFQIIWTEAEQADAAPVELSPLRIKATLSTASHGVQDPRTCVMETGTRIRVRRYEGVCSDLPGKAFTRKDAVNTGNSDVMGSLRTLDPAFN